MSAMVAAVAADPLAYLWPAEMAAAVLATIILPPVVTWREFRRRGDA